VRTIPCCLSLLCCDSPDRRNDTWESYLTACSVEKYGRERGRERAPTVILLDHSLHNQPSPTQSAQNRSWWGSNTRNTCYFWSTPPSLHANHQQQHATLTPEQKNIKKGVTTTLRRKRERTIRFSPWLAHDSEREEVASKTDRAGGTSKALGRPDPLTNSCSLFPSLSMVTQMPKPSTPKQDHGYQSRLQRAYGQRSEAVR
jgi:hypothetical protein